MTHIEKKGFAMNHPRGITERVQRFNEERRDKKETGQLHVGTYDISDFFTNISREVFMQDLISARERIRERYGDVNFF